MFLARSELDPATLVLARIAALAAVDAPAASYLMHVAPALEAEVKVERVQDVLVAVAPIIGAARVLSSTWKITEALGIAIAVTEAALKADASSAERRRPLSAGTPDLVQIDTHDRLLCAHTDDFQGRDLA